MSHMELWKRYRPRTFDEVVGQDAAVSLLKEYVSKGEVPTVILFTGRTGCGKSTLAHILAREMGCTGLDLNVINCALTEESMGAVRDLQRQMRTSPCRGSTCRVWILEEIQSWSRSTFAQQALLLPLEEDSQAVRKSHLFLCTTNPEKLKEAVRNRCKKINLSPINDGDMRNLLISIAIREEKKNVPDSVVDHIITLAKGSAREAVNQLDSALQFYGAEDKMLSVLSDSASDDEAWKLIKALMYEKPVWEDVVKVIEEIPDSTQESFRHKVLKVSATEMKKGGRSSSRAFMIANVFSSPWYDCSESGIVTACWEIVQAVKKK